MSPCSKAGPKLHLYNSIGLFIFRRKLEEEDRSRNMRLDSEKQLKIRRRMEREERRRQIKMRTKCQTDEEEMAERIAIEERKLLIAQRKLESIRLLDELLERVKVNRNINFVTSSYTWFSSIGLRHISLISLHIQVEVTWMRSMKKSHSKVKISYSERRLLQSIFIFRLEGI